MLPHLTRLTWIAIVALTLAILFSKRLVPCVKWPLVALGASNAALMLGDVIIPATKILLSHHAGHFVQLTSATLFTFLISAALASTPNPTRTTHAILGSIAFVVFLNGTMSAAGTYRLFLPLNRQVVALTRSRALWAGQGGDLVIAASKNVDDPCGWIVLSSTVPVLFCTDAEVMLTPQQNREIHRFRQAVYLYFTGEDSHHLRSALAVSDPSSMMYRLGYWAEAVSLSPAERTQGLHAIQADLMPWLESVENHDVRVRDFFHQFRKIIVIDDQQHRTFSADRLASLMQFQGQQTADGLVYTYYLPR